MRSALTCLSLATLLVACPAKKPPLELADGCQPLLGGADCFLPYPSDFYRVEDPTQPTGFKVQTRGASRLMAAGTNIDVHAWKPMDGFSRVPTLVTFLPADVSPAGFPHINDAPENSIVAKSNTLIIEAATGRLIPHFVDFDPRATDPLRRAMVLHPIVGLLARTRYVVGVHHAKDKAGRPIDAPEGFRRLRDGEAQGDDALEPLRKHFENDVFPVLAAASIPKSELQLAWDFTTGSDESVTADLLRVRELTLAWLMVNEPQIRVTGVEENPDSNIWRRVRGTIEGPLFTNTADPGARLVRDEGGKVKQNGTVEFPFEAQIPVSVRDQFGPGKALQYGHGFFGGLGETHGSSARHLLDRLRSVMFATVWWGMSTGDVGKVADGILIKPHRVMDFTERIPQGLANWMVLSSAIGRGMTSQTALMRPNTPGVPGVSMQGTQSNQGQLTYDKAAGNFIGISEGHILGGTLAALDPQLRRVVLQVGGAGFTHMMMRSRPLDQFLSLLGESIEDPLLMQAYIATLQRHFDRFDPATFAPYVSQAPLPGSPEDRRILLQFGLGDAEVPNVSSLLHARLLKLPLLDPATVAPFEMTKVPSPHNGSAACAFDFKLDVAALYANALPPPEDNVVHGGVRELEAALSQMEHFYRTGQVMNACDGPCDPE